jgi:hypothetical protein
MTAEGAEDFVKIGSDGHFVFEEILKPEIVVSVGQSDQGQEVTEADADGWFLSRNVELILRRRIDTKMRGHR